MNIYEISSNSNDKMSQRVYIDFILNSVIKSCFETNEKFILKKNENSKHESRNNNNIVWRWKKKHELKYYFNVLKSFDLFVIENCWQFVKQHLSKSDHWNDVSTLNAIKESWNQHVNQNWINYLISTMKNRMHDVLNVESKMIKW